MNHDIDKIEQNPPCLLIAGPAETLLTLFFCRLTYLISNSPHLSITCTRGDYKIIRSRRFALQVQNNNVTAMSPCCNPCCVQSKGP
jgi:hypothetical protein